MHATSGGELLEQSVSVRRATIFIISTLALTLALLGAVALLNYRVDPFQHFRLAPATEARFPRALQRYINPGLARNAQYDYVITGSSLMENYDLAEVAQLCDAKPVNLATSAMSAFEQRKVIEVALRHRAPRRVVMTLDFNSFAPPIDASLPEISEPLPLYLYDDNPWNDFPYLLGGTVAMRSLSILAGVPVGRYSTDPNRAWAWDHEVVFSRTRAVYDIDPADINLRFRQGLRNLDHMKASFEANIVPSILANPETKFTLVFPPYSIVVWADFAQRNQLDISLAFKSHVLGRLIAFQNVQILDFQWDAAITHNLDLYTDIYHFSPAINRQILASACKGDPSHLLTPQSLTRFEQALRNQVRKLEIKALIPPAH
jgi:hypothetical protein